MDELAGRGGTPKTPMTIVQDLSEKQPQVELDRAFYERVRAAERRRVEERVVAHRTGYGFAMRKGQMLRVVEETGPQIATVAFWNRDIPRQTFLAGSTWPQEGVFIKPFARMFSDLPWRRPMMTCIADTVETRNGDAGYRHHFVGTHCSPELMEMRYGKAGLDGCRTHLVGAIAPFGLGEGDLHDSVSLFQKSYLDPVTGRLHDAPSDAKQGDFVEFYAEVDLIVAVTVCPFGDGTGRPDDPSNVVRPVRVGVYDTGIEPKAFPAWADWRPRWTGRWVPPAARE